MGDYPGGDWGLYFGILTVVFLVGHVLIDAYRMFRQVRALSHVEYEALDGAGCDRCLTFEEKMGDLKHEAEWTAAALVFLALHLLTDFVL